MEGKVAAIRLNSSEMREISRWSQAQGKDGSSVGKLVKSACMAFIRDADGLEKFRQLLDSSKFAEENKRLSKENKRLRRKQRTVISISRLCDSCEIEYEDSVEVAIPELQFWSLN